ncbi:MAG: sensor histidine kinase [Flavipsychrobacter sp.]
MSTLKIRYKSIRWLVHIAVWAAYLIVFLLPSIVKADLTGKLYYITHMVVLMSATYINIYVLMKKYFITEKYKAYLLSVTALWVVSLIAIYISGIIFDLSIFKKYFVKKTIAAMMGFSMEFFLLSLFKVAKEWYVKVQKSKELHYEKIQAELGLLRTQLDAHFLFNTLNNIYLLVLNKSDKAADAVLRLSELLSYNIYDGYQKKVKLSKELDFIENYINLQRLRLDDTQRIFYKVNGEANSDIEPLILFNFVENTFKHAYENVLVDGVAYYVYIEITLEGESLTLTTINRYKPNVTVKSDKTGIGNNNTIKRLELTYGDNYSLDVNTEQQIYNVVLKINSLA